MALPGSPLEPTFGWRLLPGRVVRLHAPEGARLRARDGLLWITFETGGDTREDLFLRAGEYLALPPGARVVASASDARRGLAMFDWLPRPSAHPQAARRRRQAARPWSWPWLPALALPA